MTGKEEETMGKVTTDELLKLIDTIAADGWDAKGMAAIRARIEQHDGLVEALAMMFKATRPPLRAKDLANGAFADELHTARAMSAAALARAGDANE